MTLPETTLVFEAARLQNGLRRAGIEPWGWIVMPAWQRRIPSTPAGAARGT